MTDKERIEKNYKKIQKKYPDVTNKDEIDNLAIKADKRNTLLVSAGCFLGAVVCLILFFVLYENDSFEMTKYLLLVMTGSGIFECVRTLGKYSKIEQRYRPVIKVAYEGQLTKDRIIQDGGRVLKKAEYAFSIDRLTLDDKEDETDVGFSNDTHHRYCMYIRQAENYSRLIYKAKRNQYMDAVIGAEYFVVFTPSNDVVAVYQAANWTVSEELQVYFPATVPQVSTAPSTAEVYVQSQPVNSVYQPNNVQITTEPEQTKKLLPILAIVLSVLSFFCPIIAGVPLSVASLVLAIIGLTKQRSKLSVAAIIISGVWFIMLMFSVIANMAGWV